ncbi:MAG: hypothetical protein Q4A58_06025 [Fusobacterium sp.]|uniref:hypothetical protein n=1 Tax=Fusobacterium sp. TaxID=68766 RepID=UPI0026DD6689|nr:hypothetical protein [Fusobacterium sp.]MDO4690832.1 hypothetical protein [Fusobacterium sp.]
MLNFLKGISKNIKIIGAVFFTVAFLCFLIVFNLEKNLEFITKKFLGVNLKIEKINLSFNKVKLDNVVIYDKKNRVMLELPYTELDYSLFKLRLEELNIESPKIFLIEEKDGLNLRQVFKENGENKNIEVEDEKKEVEGKEDYRPKSLPIENINLKNLLLSYRFERDDKTFEKTLKGLNATIKSGKNKGIIVELESLENLEKFKVLYSNKDEPYYLELNIDGIDLSSYQKFISMKIPKIEKISGLLKSEAILSSKQRDGYVKLSSLELYHRDIESVIKADFELNLDKEDIYTLIDYEIFNERAQMEAMYKDGELYSLIQIKDLSEEKLSKIVPLRESKIDLSKIDIADIILLTKYNKEKGLRFNFDLKPNKFEYRAIKLDSIKADFIIKDGEKRIEDSHIFLKIADMPVKLSLEANILGNTTDLNFQIYNLDKTSNLIPNFNGSIKIENNKENINTEMVSNIISFKANYDKKEKNLEIYDENLRINYNREKDILNGSGKLDFIIYDLKNSIKFSFEEGKVLFEDIKIESENNKGENLKAEGYYDLRSKNFNFSYNATELTISRLYKGQEIKFVFQGKGEFERYHSVLTGIGNIKGLNLSYLGDMKSLTGKYSLNLNENNEFEIEFNGKVEELNYGDYKLKDVLVKLAFEKNILNIKKMGNDYLSLTGKIDRLSQEANLKLKISNLNNKVIGFEQLAFNIKDIEGDLNGSLENPNVNLNIKDVELYIQENIAKLKGTVKIRDKKMIINDIKLNKNRLFGNYDLENKKYDLKLLINDNLSNYAKGDSLDYRLTGEVLTSGIGAKLKSNLSIQGVGRLKDMILPKINVKASYSAKNYSDGLIKVESLKAQNSAGKNLVNFQGSINLKNKLLNLISNETLDFKDLSEYTKIKDIEGTFELNTSLKGSIKNPMYTLFLNSDHISISNNEITEINSKLNGDKDSLNIETLSFKYLENKILGNGEYSINSKKYDLNLYTTDLVNLESLNKFFKDKGLKNISGNAAFKLNIKNSGLNGYIKMDGLNLRDEKEYIKISNLNTDIEIKDNELILKKVMANVNEGDLKIGGYVKIPKDFKNLTSALDYNIELYAKDIKYNKPDIANISISSKININNSNLDGELFINKGIIYDIPNDYKSLWGIVSKKISKRKEDKQKTEQEKKLELEKKKKSKKKLKEFSEKWDFINLRLSTKEPLILDIDDFNIVVGELKGKLDADLALEGGKGKYILTGNTEILNGYLYVNTNKFLLDRALISFNDRRSYLPEINPDIFIDSRVTMEEEDINFGIHGRLKKLMYTLSSDNGNNSGNFNSLLLDSDRNPAFEGDMNELYLKFMKNIIAGQIAQVAFGSLTKNVKKTLGLSKLTIKPEVSVYNIDSKVSSASRHGNNLEVYDIGAKIEAEKNLYRDSVYLYGTAKLFGSNKNSVIQSSIEKNGIKDYDVGIEYRTKDDKVIGIGVGTVPDRYIHEDRNKKRRNYHIDFKIRKKYNSFSEIFSF